MEFSAQTHGYTERKVGYWSKMTTMYMTAALTLTGHLVDRLTPRFFRGQEAVMEMAK